MNGRQNIGKHVANTITQVALNIIDKFEDKTKKHLKYLSNLTCEGIEWSELKNFRIFVFFLIRLQMLINFFFII